MIPFRDEEEAVAARQRHDLRPVGLGLDARRREGAARGARDRDRRDLDQLEHLGARVHAVRRLQAVGHGPRAGPARARPLHRAQERLLRDGGLMGRLDGKVCVITGTASGIGAESARLFQSEGAQVVGVDLSPDAVGDLAIQADVTDAEQVEGMYAQARERVREDRRAVQQRRHLARRRRLDPRHLRRGLGSRAEREPASRSSSAASSASRTCSTTAAGRSSTPPRSWR